MTGKIGKDQMTNEPTNKRRNEPMNQKRKEGTDEQKEGMNK